VRKDAGRGTRPRLYKDFCCVAELHFAARPLGKIVLYDGVHGSAHAIQRKPRGEDCDR
jgi:hypothetical protein